MFEAAGYVVSVQRVLGSSKRAQFIHLLRLADGSLGQVDRRMLRLKAF